MIKNVIPTHQTEVHWRHSQRRSHITMLFRRITPFWNIEMPHKRDQTKLLTTPHQEVKRCGTSTTKKKTKKNHKSLCANFNEELQASSEEFKQSHNNQK